MKKIGIGYYELSDDVIVINEGRESCTLKVTNEGERTIQIGSHFHFFEVNRDLLFDRGKAYGKHLDIPSGTSLRWTPGKTLTVQLTEYGGDKKLYGFNGLVNGEIYDEAVKKAAFQRAKEKKYLKEVPHE
jgi:urease beta subunit